MAWVMPVPHPVPACPLTAKAIRRELSFKNEAGKEYKLNDKIATLQIRPRGWHLDEST